MIEVQRFIFPDGQPHVAVKSDGGKTKEIVARITCPNDLFDVLLQADALRSSGVETLNLTIPYLMGARMDRPMPDDERGSHPFTLEVVAETILTGGFHDIRIFDPHSPVSTKLLQATGLVPWPQVGAVMSLLPTNTLVVIPDAGAKERTAEIFKNLPYGLGDGHSVQVLKHRDSATGKLSGFGFEGEPAHRLLTNKECLIVDDLCDGGGTFTGVADLLRGRGASKVHLYVSHGIFSKGFEIPGIDRVFTTNSYRDWGSTEGKGANMIVLPWR